MLYVSLMVDIGHVSSISLLYVPGSLTFRHASSRCFLSSPYFLNVCVLQKTRICTMKTLYVQV